VTLQLLWEEHRAVHPDGYGYSRYCELYRAWEARLSPTMRQSHVAGERMFVDYAGTTLEVRLMPQMMVMGATQLPSASYDVTSYGVDFHHADNALSRTHLPRQSRGTSL
jgi:hypothetical protein